MKTNRLLIGWKVQKYLLIIFLCTLSNTSIPQKLTPEMLGKPREEIRFTDNQLRLFNGRGCIYPKQNSLTGLHMVQFPPVEIAQYQFRIDIRDDNNGILMQDNIPELWDDWKERKAGYDPLGVNFRAGYPYAVLVQNEYWEPNSYHREGTYHKKYSKQWVSFSIETESLVSGERDEVYLEIKISNRGTGPLSLTMVPVQLVRFEDQSDTDNKQIYQKTDIFTLENALYRVALSSDLEKYNDDGWKWEIPANTTEIARFAIHLQSTGDKPPEKYVADLEKRIRDAQQTTRNRLVWAAENLPVISTEHKRLDEFYKRCIFTVSECKWERENFIVNPFWTAGNWLYTIPWDICFLADVLTMMSPESMRETIGLSFSDEDLVCSNMGWDGCAPGVFYIMQPYALKMMIDAYLRQTGDTEFLNEILSGKTILSWMKEWGDLLADDFTSKTSGMVDIGQDTEALVEIRTDGYDHVVPVLNGHTVEYYRWLGSWCKKFGDADGVRFNKMADDLEKRFHENLWNAENRWFDNLYPDGGRKPVYSVLQFDLIGLNILTGEERLGLLSHLNDNEFLGPYSTYSMSRQDRDHWDRVDTDWGGGGSYTGIPMQLVRNLYQTGMGTLAWTILSRFTNYVDYFPYISQNFRADELFQDESSMPMAICAGAGVEAVVFGLFGLSPQIDGTLDIHPYYAHELGKANLEEFRYREHSYDISMDRYGFKLKRDGQSIGAYSHGESVRIFPDGRVLNHDNLSASIPTVETDQFIFADQKKIILKTSTKGAFIYYTLDGSTPTLKSTKYNGPFSITKSCQLKAVALHPNLAASKVAVTYFEKVDASEIETAPFMIKDFLISRSIHGYTGPEGKNEYPLNKKNMQWKKANVDERGIVWLSQQLTPFDHCHAFAVTEFICKEAGKATILTGTNDGAFIWLNEELILDNYKERPLYYNQFELPVQLKKGKNTLVLLVNQAGGSWGFHVNVKTQEKDLKVVLPDLEQ